MKLVPGRYSMTVYPCGCSVGRVHPEESAVSIGVCDEHLRHSAVELALLAGVVSELGAVSGAPTVVDTVKMGEDFVEYMRERVGDEDEDEDEAVDGTA